MTSYFQNGCHDFISHIKVLPPGECEQCLPDTYAAESASSWSIVHLYLFGHRRVLSSRRNEHVKTAEIISAVRAMAKSYQNFQSTLGQKNIDKGHMLW